MTGRLYIGHVMHCRLIPRRHFFRYRVFSLLVDVDHIERVCAGLRLLSYNRFGALAFHDRDHGFRDGSPLRPWVDNQLELSGLPAAAQVQLLCFPRIWGYVFNPLSVYFCRDAEGRLESLIYEVKNTFGEQIAYALPAGPNMGGAHRQRQVKEMYVSPFIGMEQTYRFDVRDPEDSLRLRIRQSGPEGETLIATHTGTGHSLDDRQLASALAGHPLMTLKVMAAIHFEALRLVLKGVRIARPGALQATGEA